MNAATAIARGAAIRRQIQGIGRLVDDGAARARWIELVESLHDHVVEGALAGWLFHGTERGRGAVIARRGLTRSCACVETRRGGKTAWRWTSGTHWTNMPSVAAFYAEDLIESLERQIEFSIVATRIDDIDHSRLRVDAQSLDCPLRSRIGLDDEEDLEAATEEWETSAMDWRASLAFTGSLVFLERVPARVLHVVDTIADVGRLVEWSKTNIGHGKRKTPHGRRDRETPAEFDPRNTP